MTFRSVATYLPGDRVTGVVVRETGGLPDLAVHVVSLIGIPIADVAGWVRAAVTAAAPGSRVDVHVDDVDEEAPMVKPGELPPGPTDDRSPIARPTEEIVFPVEDTAARWRLLLPTAPRTTQPKA